MFLTQDHWECKRIKLDRIHFRPGSIYDVSDCIQDVQNEKYSVNKSYLKYIKISE
jgi:hypothetical protein